MRKNHLLKNLILAAFFLALCIVLPFLTGQIPQLGSAFLPMHLPVLLCGFVCGWPYGLVVGAVAPLLRFALLGMPPIFPTGVAMAFELAAYGAVAGIMYKVLKKNLPNTYIALLTAMLAGRAVWGGVMFALSRLAGVEFSPAIFLAGAFANALPGIICQIVLIPVIVLALRKAKLIE